MVGRQCHCARNDSGRAAGAMNESSRATPTAFHGSMCVQTISRKTDSCSAGEISSAFFGVGRLISAFRSNRHSAPT